MIDPNSERLSELVYQQMVDRIISGKYVPGDIVSELALSKEINVSRTPVHEAVRKLVKDGLLIQRTNRRPEIAAITSADVLEIFQMRQLLEGEAAFRSADRIDRRTLENLRVSVEGLVESAKLVKTAPEKAEWIHAWGDGDELLHASIGAAGGCRRLAEDIARYRLLHRAFNNTKTDFEGLQAALGEHRRILDALDRRDGEAARSAMVEHIREWQAFFVHAFEQNESVQATS